jgi:hypothetical protein
LPTVSTSTSSASTSASAISVAIAASTTIYHCLSLPLVLHHWKWN